jgi:hypothetical protein
VIRGRAPHYGKFTRTFPEDPDGDAIYQVANLGSDLSQPMEIDFIVAVPDEAAGKAVARAARGADFVTEVATDEDGEWIVYCTRTMIASYEGVVTVQEELRRLAGPLGGEPDGWETAGNVSEAEAEARREEISHGQRLGGRGGW